MADGIKSRKFLVIKFGKSVKTPECDYHLDSNTLQESDEKDLRVIINNKLSPEDHKWRRPYKWKSKKHMYPVREYESNLYLYQWAYGKKIITSFIRPTLEYAAIVWNLHVKKHITNLKKVQRAAKRWMPSLRDHSYEERFDKLQLSTLEERRKRDDMITLYDINVSKVK